ncbi:MAG TPA: cobalt transporter CbiM [Anaerolineae bacterium]
MPTVFLSGVLAPILSHQAMHIPDGYLSPLTAAVMFLLVLPFWARGARTLRQTLSAANVPLIALLAAFSFVIMMFNVPLPGGTSGHAVGGVLAAVILGPDVAVIAISIALVIQAFFFGDGGLLALGANCFNMAVVLPYTGAAIYRLLAGDRTVSPRRRALAAGLGGYAGLSLAALFTAVEFGLQPALFHAADGTPLYAPYPLAVSIPAMVLPHLAVASVVEGLLTGLVVAYLLRTNPALLALRSRPGLTGEATGPGGRAALRGLFVSLAVLVVATPLGLLAPGTAWGEWSGAELARLGFGFVPAGLARLGGLWGAPLARYDLPALGNAKMGYVLSALLGVFLAGVVAWLLTLALTAGRQTAAVTRKIE